MAGRKKHILNPKECDEIRNAIARSESATSGEVVVVLARETVHGPLLSVFLFFMLLGLDFTWIIYEIIQHNFWLSRELLGFTTILSLCVLGIILPRYLTLSASLRRLFVTQEERNRQLQAAAELQFYRRNVRATRAATGILLYVSFAERKVIVMGDRAINEKVKQQDWDEIISEIVSLMKTGNITSAIINGIGKAGFLLAKHFPPAEDDTNELDDHLIQL